MKRIQLTESLNYVMEKKRYDGKLRDFESKTGKVVKYAASAIVPVGPILLLIYRYATDKCRKSCGSDQQCYNRCYENACEKVLTKIQQEMQKAKQMPEGFKKNSKIRSLNRELSKWTKRRNKYKNLVVR